MPPFGADTRAGALTRRERAAIAILTAGGWARRTAERALAAGAGLVWDVTPGQAAIDGLKLVPPAHLRRSRWHDCMTPMPPDRDPLTGPGKFARLPLEAYQAPAPILRRHVNSAPGCWPTRRAAASNRRRPSG